MKKAEAPPSKTVFVCVHAREDGRASCGAPGRGGAELLRALKDGIKAAGLKGKARAVGSGCLDLCEQGPNAFLHPSGERLCGLSPGDAPEILRLLSEPG